MRTSGGRTSASLVAAVALALSGTAMATNGYFTHGVGAESKGMAGTGIGSNADMGAIMTASNPALGVFVSDRWEAGLSIFSPRRSFEALNAGSGGNPIDLGGGLFLPTHSVTPGKIDSSSEYFPIPYVAKNWSTDAGGNITLNFYGRGGMNTDWDDSNASATSVFCWNPQRDGFPQRPIQGPGPYCAGEAGVDLSQAFLAVNYSAFINDKLAWGFGPIFAVQAFEAKGVATFVPFTEVYQPTVDPNTGFGDPSVVTSLSDNGHDLATGFGFEVGFWYGLSDAVGVGLSYQSKISMSEFDDYSDLFAEDGGFDIPSSIKAGISFVATDKLRVNVDVEQTAFSDVGSVGNPMSNLFRCSAFAPFAPPNSTAPEFCLGGSEGAGFGWDDMTSYKLGFEYTADDNNTFRFGYSNGEQPVQADDVLFNILAPGVMEQHFTFGWTRKTSNGRQFTMSLMYAPESDVTGTSAFDPLQQIKLSMSQLEFELSYRW